MSCKVFFNGLKITLNIRDMLMVEKQVYVDSNVANINSTVLWFFERHQNKFLLIFWVIFFRISKLSIGNLVPKYCGVP